ncbi:RHS repeat-associated core domain-containing protein, partial [Sphingobacterium alkalisoli]
MNRNIQYFDGLGRPMQGVQWQASPNSKKDIVQHIEYDGFGRENKKYLPYVHADGNGSYKAGGSGNVETFYTRTTGADIAGVVRTPKPYAETVFEKSPLNRVLEQGAPGQTWQPAADRTTTGRTVVSDYGTNTGESVLLWKVNETGGGAKAQTGTVDNYYLPGRLYKTVIKDENWVNSSTDPDKPTKEGTVEEYKDFEDRVVLKRIWKSESDSLSTYYVYDDFGDLRYVIPPGYTAPTVTDNSTLFNELVYAYRYDGRRRLIEKKIPGKGWEYIVYNGNDQTVLTQDAVQRAVGKWSYMKYD